MPVGDEAPSCSERAFSSLCTVRVGDICNPPVASGHRSFSGEGSISVDVEELCCFLALNSSLRLAFLRSVEGLAFFLVNGALLLVVSKEKEKVGPTEREKLKTWPWLANAWQKSMHLEAREELSSPTAHILALLLKKQKWRAVEHAATTFTLDLGSIPIHETHRNVVLSWGQNSSERHEIHL